MFLNSISVEKLMFNFEAKNLMADFQFSKTHSINCGGKLLDLSEPIVMGILNVTPDSFYDGGRYENLEKIHQQVEKMVLESAKIIDIGGMSTRPGGEIISPSEELRRVLPVINNILKHFPEVFISVDTVHAAVAKEVIVAGAHIINDISGGQIDNKMFETVAELQVPYVLMHSRGTPQTMSKLNQYNDLPLEILDYFINRVGKLRELGVKDIIIDLGFGFAKSGKQNFELLKAMPSFKILDLPILAGLSRKSMIWRTLNISPDDALNGTTALNMVALQNGANILRVHDVKEAVETIKLFRLVG